MIIERGEKWRTLLCGALFGLVALAVVARLAWLQGTRAAANLSSVHRAQNLVDPLPAPRGTIRDRHGRRLAYDRPVLTVRAEFHARVAKGVGTIPEATIELLGRRLVAHLMADPRRQETERAGLQTALIGRLRRAHARAMPSKSRTTDYLAVDFLVVKDLDSHEVVRRLRAAAQRWQRDKDLPGRLYLSFLRGYRRSYPDREATIGPVGNFYIARATPPIEAWSGLEGLCGLWPDQPGAVASGPVGFHELDYRDATRRRFWAGRGRLPGAPSEVGTTLDLDLQKAAHHELCVAERAVSEHYDSGPYTWGAMVLVEIATGDVLALASHHPDRDGAGGACAPTQFMFEPGSVVKPLVLALALERGKLGWQETIDCRPVLPRNGKPVPGTARVIYDDHACGVLTPHEVLVNSSNIGAVLIGSRLSRQDFTDYLRLYGFGRRTDLCLPGEIPAGRRPGAVPIVEMRDVYFRRDTAPSLSFGYEVDVTAVQLARAYLTLLSGAPRELRLIRSYRASAQEKTSELPPAPPGPRFLSPATVARVTAALRDVVQDDEHATGRTLARLLAEHGCDGPIIAGKTGTSDSGIRGVRQKTATFVGFAPVDVPRYLCVCVLRKDRAARFYGGLYAAPPAGRLLLEALASDKESHRRPRSEQVSVRVAAGARSSATDSGR